MSRRLAIAVGVLLLTAGAVVAGVLLSTSTVANDEPVPELRAGEAFAATAEVSPPLHRFGDPVEARLQLAISRQLADPERIEVNAQFAPYDSVRPVSIRRRDVGEVTVLTFEYVLHCLSTACLSVDGTTDIDVPETVVALLRTDTRRQIEARVPWPTMTVVARAAGDGVVAIPTEATIDELPEPTYRIEPVALRWLATGLAAVAIVALGVWGSIALWRRPRTVTIASAPIDDPLALALERLGRVDEEPASARRVALESLAHALEGVDGTTLVVETRRLAWSRAAPSRSEIDELTEAVRETLRGLA